MSFFLLRVSTECVDAISGWIAQLVREMAIAGKADPERRIDAGPSSLEAGVRVRYEFRREVAPYVGVTWNQKLYGTAKFARQDDEATGGARLTLGVRAWF